MKLGGYVCGRKDVSSKVMGALSGRVGVQHENGAVVLCVLGTSLMPPVARLPVLASATPVVTRSSYLRGS